jgi:hypothetical protein
VSGLLAIAGPFAGTSDAQTSSGPSAVLTARLAVLQRPQTPSDVLPSGLKLPPLGEGTIIPGLTRLVATPAGASVYLAVFTPARGRLPLWSPSLGDQVSLVSVTARGAELTEPVPAVDLSNGKSVGIIGAASAVSGGAGISSDRWHYGVLPNTNPTLTISTGPHSHKTIHPPDGVYIYRTGG